MAGNNGKYKQHKDKKKTNKAKGYTNNNLPTTSPSPF